MFVVFDLDGTLACDDHRVKHLLGETKDYETYFSLCGDDMPIKPTMEFLNMLHEKGHCVEIWTGRPEYLRDETQKWLGRYTKNSNVRSIILLMRKDDDYRSVREVKGEWLKRLVKKPDLVLDDRTSSVQWWRDMGIPCWQVQQRDY